MNDHTALHANVKAEPDRNSEVEGKILGAVVLGLGGAATIGWLAFLGWGMMSLARLLTG